MTRSQALTDVNDESYLAKVPGSKSYTNRALILAAMRPGTTDLLGGLKCDDTYRMSEALNAFGGLTVSETENGFRIVRKAERLTAPLEPLHLDAAGTPARFLLAFSTAAEGETTITGTKRLCERPMGEILDALRALGIEAHCLEGEQQLPVRITGSPITSRTWATHGQTSSQSASALLLLASQQSQGPVRIELRGRSLSAPYIDMTLAMMNACGIPASRTDDSAIVVQQAVVQGDTIAIEPDASSMACFLAAAAITGSEVQIQGIGSSSIQGDVGLAHIFEQMGCTLSITRDAIRLKGGPLTGLDIDMGAMPDVVMLLAVVAARASGTSRITNIGNLRFKESDRLHAMASGLQQLGVTVEQGDDFLIIHPDVKRMIASPVATYDDHRVAMAFSVLGLVVDGIEIEHPECVAKSFPGYWQELNRFRAHHHAAPSGP
ncbi:MAG: 3-phosphoshikimate 1-carboxyvinyltransferase [Planctomycetota bacterium]|nr:3-phosphoshikimate 1-carboxyvinyltransferase [Planctomycetota bacterium]